jgi:hypothetical protein
VIVPVPTAKNQRVVSPRPPRWGARSWKKGGEVQRPVYSSTSRRVGAAHTRATAARLLRPRSKRDRYPCT